jgi:F-type H+-transporting ATPase subunit b
MDIIKNFGLDPYLLLAQVLNFLVILYLLKRFLYPPLFKMHERRRELAKEAVDNAAESQKLLDHAKEDEREIIKKARLSAEQIIQDAKDQANLIMIRAEERAKIQSERVIEEAHAQIVRETEAVERSLENRIGSLSVGFLKRILPTVFSIKTQDEVVDKVLKEIKEAPTAPSQV